MMKTTLFCCKIFVTARSKLFIALDLNLAILKNVYCSQSLVLQSANRKAPFSEVTWPTFLALQHNEHMAPLKLGKILIKFPVHWG